MVLAAIESVKGQNYRNLEIIMVDDGSTDYTLAKVSAVFPEVHIVKLDGTGPGMARNAGVAASGGDILMFLDSDDAWMARHVSRLVKTINRGYPVAYGVAHTKNEIGGLDFLIPENGKGIEGDCFRALLRWCFLIPSAVALTREAFQAVGGFAPVSHGEDWTFFLKLAARYPFGFAGPEPITMRRLHRGSLCFLSGRKKLLAIIRQVFTVVKSESRATTADCHHFARLYEWTSANMSHEATVQDWYLAMLQEKII
jgi:glycosyltransferase involved in cell wall biosynthesis